MAKTSKKQSGTKNETRKEDILDKINPDDAFAILGILAREDTSIAKRIEKIAIEQLREIDVDDITSQLYFELDSIPVEDVWDNSGSTRYGYVEPNGLAWEMFEEALEPFLEELKKYQGLSMDVEAKKCCMDILKGIYKFEEESNSEYKDWAVDAPKDFFRSVLSDWKKGCKNKEDVQEIEEFAKKNFRGWYQRT
jgi:hypothetical protein